MCAQEAEGFPGQLTAGPCALLPAEVVTRLRAATGSADDLDEYVPTVYCNTNAYKTQWYYTDSGFEFNTLFYTSYTVGTCRSWTCGPWSAGTQPPGGSR